MVCFEDWFFGQFLPETRHLRGAIALIGDNLSSHFTPKIVEECAKKHIKFIPLPPNSTHLCQPLDVSFFRPMKEKWRAQLTNYKQGQSLQSKNMGVEKKIFPKMLKELMKTLNENATQNIINGFRKCGIHPFCPREVYNRLPGNNTETVGNKDNANALDRRNQSLEDINAPLHDAFLEHLSTKRYRNPQSNTRGRNRKVNVQPGKGVTMDCFRDTVVREYEAEASTSGMEWSAEDFQTSTSHSDHEESNTTTSLCKGDFVLVNFRTKKSVKRFTGQITDMINKDDFEVNFQKQVDNENAFIWPELVDTSLIKASEIERKLKPPTTLRRNKVRFDEVNPLTW